MPERRKKVTRSARTRVRGGSVSLRAHSLLRRCIEEALPGALAEMWRWREDENVPEWLHDEDRIDRAVSWIMARIEDEVLDFGDSGELADP